MSNDGTRIVLLIEDDYQILEGWYTKLRLEESGVLVHVVGNGRKSTFSSKEGYPMKADSGPEGVAVEDFDGLVVPGGFAPDNMRLVPAMVQLVRDMHNAGKLVAAICHGGWMLVSAGAVRGHRATGYLPIHDDVENAGGTWVDAPVVRDGNVITSRTPEDLPYFLPAILAYLQEQGSRLGSEPVAVAG